MKSNDTHLFSPPFCVHCPLLSVCLSFLLSSSLSLKFGKFLQQFETREFCVILTWTLKIKVKSESHCLGETGAFCPAQTHSTRAKAQQGWAPTHFLGKQHVYFTGISSALPISAPHTMCSKHTASAIQNIQTFIGHPHLGKPNGVFSLLVNNNNTIIA